MASRRSVVKIVAIAALLICLGGVNWSILGKEKHISAGQSMFIELAPVDPRSLMQGDYMALNFKMSDDIRDALAKEQTRDNRSKMLDVHDGLAIVQLDEQARGTFKGLYKNQTISYPEILVRYRVRKGEVKFATNAFFFQEGLAPQYEQARFGHFRVNKNGELLLTSMHDAQLNDLANPKN